MKFHLEVLGGITLFNNHISHSSKTVIIGRYNYYLPQIKQNIDTK